MLCPRSGGVLAVKGSRRQAGREFREFREVREFSDFFLNFPNLLKFPNTAHPIEGILLNLPIVSVFAVLDADTDSGKAVANLV